MDIEQALNQIDTLISKSAKANVEAIKVKLSESKRQERIRERNRLLWADHFSRLAASLRKRATDYEGRATALLEEGEINA